MPFSDPSPSLSDLHPPTSLSKDPEQPTVSQCESPSSEIPSYAAKRACHGSCESFGMYGGNMLQRRGTGESHPPQTKQSLLDSRRAQASVAR